MSCTDMNNIPEVLVTGASGFIAKRLVPSLAKRMKIRLFGRKEPAIECEKEVVCGDLRDYDLVREAVAGIDFIVHLGAITANRVHDNIYQLDVNLKGTYNLIEAAVREKVKKFVFASSIAAYGCLDTDYFVPDFLPVDESHQCKPKDTYGLSKFLGEEILKGYARKNDITVICFRFTGIWDLAVWNPTQQTAQSTLWSAVDIRDVIQAVELALDGDIDIKKSEVFNIGSQEIWVKENTIELIKKHYPRVKLFPGREYFQENSRASLFGIEKAKQLLGFKPKYELCDYKNKIEK